MYKNMAVIIADDIAWNEHDWWYHAQIKISISTPNQWKHRLSTHNMTKYRQHGD